MRGSYRAEGLLAIAVTVLGALIVPIACAAGTAMYDAQRRYNEAHPVQSLHGVLNNDTWLGGGSHRAEVRWIDPGTGAPQAARLPLAQPGRAGDAVTLWQDSGHQVSATQSVPPHPVSAAVLVALAIITAAMTSLAGAAVALHKVLARRRCDSWQREWETATNSPDWRKL